MIDVFKMVLEWVKEFDYFFEVFEVGCLFYVGFVFGFDRMVVLMSGILMVRDVIVFLKMMKGEDLFVKSLSKLI